MTHRVYRFYDSAGRLLYVGVTADTMEHRLAQHRREQPWFDEISRVEVDRSLPMADAFYVEHQQIRAQRPLYNRLWNEPAPDEAPAPGFGTALRSARIAASMSQAETAELVGVSLRTVRRWEAGGSFPAAGVAIVLGRTLGVELFEALVESIEQPEPVAA